jgi:hypothetical protein
MWFITSVIVVSAFGLPAVLWRAGVVSKRKYLKIYFLISNLDSDWFNEFYHGS